MWFRRASNVFVHFNKMLNDQPYLLYFELRIQYFLSKWPHFRFFLINPHLFAGYTLYVRGFYEQRKIWVGNGDGASPGIKLSMDWTSKECPEEKIPVPCWDPILLQMWKNNDWAPKNKCERIQYKLFNYYDKNKY